VTGRLAGRVAVVTGAGDGIGAGVARAFAAEGAKVVVAELNEETGRAVAAEIDGHYVRTDVGDRAQVEAMVAAAVSTYGSIDILVNNAWSAATICRVEEKTEAMIDGALEIGFKGPLWAMQAAFGPMKERGWGRVINMCSLNGVNAHIGSLEYNATKEALRTLTRTAAREWAPTGVVVNALCPGAKSAAFRRVMGEHPEMAAMADQANPMGRIGDPLEDIAPVAVFLASEDCRYLTGNTLFVDGGAHINGVAWQPELP
jgi:NAD(P)-dependent dehydrogenase (short-subunit alcohol dehydrogenase family)